MGSLAVITALLLDKRLADPEGFLGPSWLRLPLLLSGAFLGDLVPRTLWVSRGNPARWGEAARERVRTHWTRERLTLEPNGAHLMLIDLVQPLEKGKRFPVTLRFERAGEIEVEFEVQELCSRHPRH